MALAQGIEVLRGEDVAVLGHHHHQHPVGTAEGLAILGEGLHVGMLQRQHLVEAGIDAQTRGGGGQAEGDQQEEDEDRGAVAEQRRRQPIAPAVAGHGRPPAERSRRRAPWVPSSTRAPSAVSITRVRPDAVGLGTAGEVRALIKADQHGSRQADDDDPPVAQHNGIVEDRLGAGRQRLPAAPSIGGAEQVAAQAVGQQAVAAQGQDAEHRPFVG